MKTKKRLGIWMDHANAFCMEFAVDTFEVKTINSDHVSMINQQPLLQSESALHNKEKQILHAYYKSLMDVIRGHDEVVLYGPTKAKTELYNLIRADHHFDGIKIETKSANKMSFKEQHAFIKDYFSKLLNYESPYNK
jgi:stalled ribosome rescue protein Dom34